jgi:hypothetical protein
MWSPLMPRDDAVPSHYDANVYNLGIAPCGRYAIVHTCNAPNSDGFRLDLLIIEGRRNELSAEPSVVYRAELAPRQRLHLNLFAGRSQVASQPVNMRSKST